MGHNYNKFIYIFPPRPKNAIPISEVGDMFIKSYIYQPKLNGSNVTIYTNGEVVIVMNRHNEPIENFILSDSEIIKYLYKSNVTANWIVINGEYMNKSKRNKKDVVFNHKFVIFDILVYDNIHLIGSKSTYRINLLKELYGINESEDEYLYGISDNIYMVKTYDYTEYLELYNSLILIDMYEGLVAKQKRAKLEVGTTVSNNSKSQFKCRKPTKNYQF